MIGTRGILALALLSLCAGAVEAQVRSPNTQTPRVLGQPVGTAQGQGQIGTPNYDVVLEVPELSVDSIGLNVENLRAHLALNANAVNLVSVVAGVDVGIDRVRLDITGVLAEAYVYVDLDNVTRIVDRVLRTLNNNPQLVTRLLTTVDTVVNTVGGVANTALQPGGVVSQTVGTVGQTLNNVTQPGGLLSQTVNTLGQTVQRTVDTSGNLVERTLDTTGNLLSQRSLGSLLNAQGLRVLSSTTNAAGQTVRQVQDQAGAVIEYTLDQAGRIANARVIRQGTAR
jgi:hypothetical protein